MPQKTKAVKGHKKFFRFRKSLKIFLFYPLDNLSILRAMRATELDEAEFGTTTFYFGRYENYGTELDMD